MSAARITRSALPDFTSFEYEQCPAGKELGIMKFDHSPLQDGHWHQLNRSATAFYRYFDSYFQMVAPELEEFEGDCQPILQAVAQAGPLNTDDELEVLIRPAGSGFEMTSVYVNFEHGARFVEFTAKAWNAAYLRLLELEDQF